MQINASHYQAVKPMLSFDLIFSGTILLNLRSCAVQKSGNLTPSASDNACVVTEGKTGNMLYK